MAEQAPCFAPHATAISACSSVKSGSPVCAAAPTPPSPVAGAQGRSRAPRQSNTMIKRLGPKVAIGTDGRQWIVYRAGKGQSIHWDGAQWGADGVIHSDKQALVH